MIPGDGKIEFCFFLANWLESWKSASQSLCLSMQTCDALIRTLRAKKDNTRIFLKKATSSLQ